MTLGTATTKAWMTSPAMLLGILSGTVFLAAGPPTGGVAHPLTHRVVLRNSRFVPEQLTVSPGDTVIFVMVSGGPHNVAFWPDSLPVGAALTLAAGVPEPIDTLMGPLLVSEGARYTVVFGALPAGRYPYYCLPHLGSGMRAEVLVREQ